MMFDNDFEKIRFDSEYVLIETALDEYIMRK